MKVKVIRKFRDIHTGEIHDVDDVLEVTEERYAEINTKKQFVRKTRARKRKADEPEQATEPEALSPTGTTEAQADAPEGEDGE